MNLTKLTINSQFLIFLYFYFIIFLF